MIKNNASNTSDDFINMSDESIEKGDRRIDTLEKSFNLLNCISGPGGSTRPYSRSRSRSRSPHSRRRDRYGDERRSRSTRRDERSRSIEGQDHGRGPRRDQQHEDNMQSAAKHAEDMIRDAERSRARLLDVKGMDCVNINSNSALLHSVIVDEGYLQVAAHIDRSLKQKIQQFEYVDFSRLLPHDKLMQQEDQRLTFVNKGGVPFLVPANENGRDGQITSYARWDQAFRVYSEIITSKFPHKAQELLQYNYVIHTAAQMYSWEKCLCLRP